MRVCNTFSGSPCVVFLVESNTDHYIEHLRDVRSPTTACLSFVFRGHRRSTWNIPNDDAPGTIIQWMRLFRRGLVPGKTPQCQPRTLSEIILTPRKTVV
jgi:hypothetical protein